MREKNWIVWSFLAPGFLVMLVFIVLPAALTLMLAFYELSLFEPLGWRGLGFENFRAVLEDRFFWKAASNTLKYLLVVPVLQALGTLFAAALKGGKGRAMVTRTLVYLPVLVPLVVASFMWRWLLEQHGALNQALLALGVIARPIPWLSDPRYALWAAMFVTIWKGIGYYALFYLAAMVQMPKEYLEAAEADGATAFQKLRFVVFPLLAPTFVVLTLLSFVSALQVFTELYLVTNRSPSVATLMLYLYDQAFGQFAFGKAAVVSLVLAVPAILLGAYLWRRFKEGGVYAHEDARSG